MYFDLPALERFYDSPLGRASASSLCRAIEKLANFRPESRLVSFGFVDPIESAVAPAELSQSVVPARLGVRSVGDRNKTPSVLSYLEALPLANESVDAAIMLHALEYSDSPRRLLKELWRILTPAGRFILLVPDRFGFWCRSEVSPFSQGEPYSKSQIRQLLGECKFTMLKEIGVLHYPPIQNPVPLRLWRVIDRYGLGPAGVIAVLAEKREESPARAKVKEIKPAFVPAAGVGAFS